LKELFNKKRISHKADAFFKGAAKGMVNIGALIANFKKPFHEA
jgi:hypothetical protein